MYSNASKEEQSGSPELLTAYVALVFPTYLTQPSSLIIFF
jgi:hypothetical protein